MSLIDAPAYPKSLYRGVLTFGDTEIECHVLDNEIRAIATIEMAKSLYGPSGQSNQFTRLLSSLLNGNNELSKIQDKEKRDDIATIEYDKSSYINDLSKIHWFVFIRPEGGYANGIAHDDVLRVYRGIKKAYRDGVLRRDQKHIADRADDIIDACSDIGLMSLIDEATGYQEFRKANELAFRMEAILQRDPREHQTLFQAVIWKEYCRVFDGSEWNGKRPPRGACPKIIREIYDFVLGQDVIEELKRRYKEDGRSPRYRDNMHQYIRDHALRPVLHRIGEVTAALKSSDTKEQFWYRMERINKTSGMQTDWIHER